MRYLKYGLTVVFYVYPGWIQSEVVKRFANSTLIRICFTQKTKVGYIGQIMCNTKYDLLKVLIQGKIQDKRF